VHDDEPPIPGFAGDRTRQAVAAVLGVVLIATLIFGGVWWFTNGPGSVIPTPKLVGQTFENASLDLKSRGLVAKKNPVFDEKVAAGQVVSTDPVAGADISKDGTVILNVSQGPELYPVPPLKNVSEDDAKAAIKDAKLTYGETTKKFSLSVDKGDVISSSPTAGTKISPDRPVNLVVSKGAQPVQLDNVVGQQINDAKTLLKSKGLDVNVTDQEFADGGPPPGTVINQDPSAQGQTVDKGSVINLTVIKLPEGQGLVPDLRGKNFDEAKNLLAQAGFQQVRKDGIFGDRVVNQSAQGVTPLDTEIVLFTSF
jgi:serine/threonine-protein kinase